MVMRGERLEGMTRERFFVRDDKVHMKINRCFHIYESIEEGLCTSFGTYFVRSRNYF